MYFPVFSSGTHLLSLFTFNPCEVLPRVAGYQEPGLTLREWKFGNGLWEVAKEGGPRESRPVSVLGIGTMQ